MREHLYTKALEWAMFKTEFISRSKEDLGETKLSTPY